MMLRRNLVFHPQVTVAGMTTPTLSSVVVADAILIAVPPIWTARRNGIAIEPTASTIVVVAIVAIIVAVVEAVSADENAVATVEVMVVMGVVASGVMSVGINATARTDKSCSPRGPTKALPP